VTVIRSIAPAVAAASLVWALCIASPGCKSKPPEARKVDTPIVRDVPAPLRNTIGAQAQLQRADPVLVSGYGLVVGLNGTGGGDLDPRISATMERMLGLNGISKNSEALAGTPLEAMTPREVLRSRDVAVVIVYAAVIPGAPVGATFDCYVSSVNRAPEVSLEGGTLWTSELQMGPPTAFGSVKTRAIAKAKGPIFINPFAEPGSRGGYGRADGRVLSGGLVTNPLPLELVLDNESHGRARAITEAINARFPERPGEGQTARGRTARIIDITVPAAYRERSQEFLGVLTHIQADTTLPQEYAKRYVEALKAQPALADDLSWSLQALPQRTAVPFLRDLYSAPDLVPRWAALRAGAGLDDALAAPSLKQLAVDGPTTIRPEAVKLLGKLAAGPTVDEFLKTQLGSGDLAVRVAAYEALADRAERVHMRRLLSQQERTPANMHILANEPVTMARSQLDIPGDTPQGVRRRVIGGKFILDSVPGGKPMIYVAQQGRPRIVLFGDQLTINRPIMVPRSGTKEEAQLQPRTPTLARLMLVADSPSDDLRVLYRYPDRIDAEGHTVPGRAVTSKASHRVPELIEFLAHPPTPEDPRPGLGMTYSEVVGALHAFQQGGAIPAEFVVEQDLLQLKLLRAANQVEVTDRPETQAEADKLRVYEPVANPKQDQPAKPPEEDLVVPLPKPSSEKVKR
jgi:hypothetical protein